MAGVEVEKIVSKTEEKMVTEPTTNETVHTDDSASVVEVEIKEEEVPKVEKEIEKTEITLVKEEKPVEIPAAVEEKEVQPAEEVKAVEVKTV